MSNENSHKSASPQGNRKTRVGRVVSDSMHKTIAVEVSARVPHPRFGKIVRMSKKFHVHDEDNEAKIGDMVRIVETRPLSKLKRWQLVEIQRHDPGIAADHAETAAEAARIARDEVADESAPQATATATTADAETDADADADADAQRQEDKA